MSPSIERVDALEQVEGWPAETVAVAVLRGGEEVAARGPREQVFRWASVTKPVTALATLVAAEEGILDLDDPAGPPGSTVRHLLAHAAGLPFEGRTPISEPGKRRSYSNTGFDILAEFVGEAAEMPFAEYLQAAVLGPLEMGAQLRGSAASELHGSLEDPLRVRGRAPASAADRAGDARGGDLGPVPRAGRRAAGHRTDGSERLGPRRRAARREASALDRRAQLPAHLRPLRQQRHVPLGRPGGGHRRSPA